MSADGRDKFVFGDVGVGVDVSGAQPVEDSEDFFFLPFAADDFLLVSLA